MKQETKIIRREMSAIVEKFLFYFSLALNLFYGYKHIMSYKFLFEQIDYANKGHY